MSFTVDGNTTMCYNYGVQDDQVCELGNLTTIFQVQLALLTTDSGIHIPSGERVATIIIDDTDEPECCEYRIFISTNYITG